jgi:site-specific recombinase XerD
MLRVLWRTDVMVNELLTIMPRDIEPQNNVINVTKAKGGKQRRAHLDAETIRCSPTTFPHNSSPR